MDWRLKGRCWKFGHDVLNDGGISSLELVRAGIFDPKELAKACMQGVDPEFAQKARPGDIIVAGRNFGKGQLHVQGPLSIKGLGVGLVTESMPRSFFRLCVAAGVLMLPYVPGITDQVNDGDELEVDFERGLIRNHTSGGVVETPPLPDSLLRIVAAGGERAWLATEYGTKGAPA